MMIGFINLLWRRWKPATNAAITRIFLASVRKAMPKVPVVQLTDLETPRVPGVDLVVRRPPEPFALFCAEHYAECQGEWLLLDADTVVQRDVQDVFKKAFDVAVCDREGTLVEGEEFEDIVKVCPHNIGVVFSRCPDFWHEVARRVRAMEEKWIEWMGNQIAACELIREGKFHVEILPGLEYNFAPQSFGTPVAQAAIVHYKGNIRKRYMLRRHA